MASRADVQDAVRNADTLTEKALGVSVVLIIEKLMLCGATVSFTAERVKLECMLVKKCFTRYWW